MILNYLIIGFDIFGNPELKTAKNPKNKCTLWKNPIKNEIEKKFKKEDYSSLGKRETAIPDANAILIRSPTINGTTPISNNSGKPGAAPVFAITA